MYKSSHSRKRVKIKSKSFKNKYKNAYTITKRKLRSSDIT